MADTVRQLVQKLDTLSLAQQFHLVAGLAEAGQLDLAEMIGQHVVNKVRLARLIAAEKGAA